MEYNIDTVIVGTGVSGCFAALNLPEDMKILLITRNGSNCRNKGQRKE